LAYVYFYFIFTLSRSNISPLWPHLTGQPTWKTHPGINSFITLPHHHGLIALSNQAHLYLGLLFRAILKTGLVGAIIYRIGQKGDESELKVDTGKMRKSKGIGSKG
jgi:hypothetical protein